MMQQMVRLYRSILRAHKETMPPPLRRLGDDYVRKEFKDHWNPKTTPEQWREFETQWRKYLDTISGSGREDMRDLRELSQEQQAQMIKLHKEINNLEDDKDV